MPWNRSGLFAPAGFGEKSSEAKGGRLRTVEPGRRSIRTAGMQPLLPPQTVVGAAPVMPLNVHDQAVAGTWSMSCFEVY